MAVARETREAIAVHREGPTGDRSRKTEREANSRRKLRVDRVGLSSGFADFGFERARLEWVYFSLNLMADFLPRGADSYCTRNKKLKKSIDNFF